MKQRLTAKSPISTERKDRPANKSHLRQGSYSYSKGIEGNLKWRQKMVREAKSQERKGDTDPIEEEESSDYIVENNAKKADTERSRSPMDYVKQYSQRRNSVSQINKNFSEPDILVQESNKVNLSSILQRKLMLVGGDQKVNKIKLIIRIRPFLITEHLKECLRVVNVGFNSITQQEYGIRLFKDYNQIHFKFDNILLPKDNQESVFKQATNIVSSFIQGSNGTVFAYGQTGAGKTYSIFGGNPSTMEVYDSFYKNENRGIIPRTLDYVFEQLKDKLLQHRARISISFFEIYNDKVFDLLSQATIPSKKGSTPPKQSLELREEKDGFFSVIDLRNVSPQSKQEAYLWLEKGLQKRMNSTTSRNNSSSRSHSIFQIHLECLNEEGLIQRSKLRIVDLAGSEKYQLRKDLTVQEKNIKIHELTSINSSLSALGQCISALADSGRKHIPYRNSKLTRVLKDSLDENSNVALIICVSPSIDSYKETFSTLQFADRAKKAILDGRNLSDSKLFHNQDPYQLNQPQVCQNALMYAQLDQNQNPMDLNSILKAYQEEKTVRKDLEKFINQNYLQKEVLDELERLKKQNQELQNYIQKMDSKVEIKPKLKSCLKKESTKKVRKIEFADQEDDRNVIMNIREEGEEDDQTPEKKVRFAHKLENDDSIDSDLRERIEHNLKYNDDTIFDNISIFRDVNNSGIILLPKKLKDNKDVHPLVLKRRRLEEGKGEETPDEDEEEDEEEKQNLEEEKQMMQDVVEKIENENMENFEDEDEEKGIIKIGEDLKGLKETIKFTEEEEEIVSGQQVVTEAKMMEIQLQQFFQERDRSLDLQQKVGVSPIQKQNKNQNSSGDVSKDLIDLENENFKQIQLAPQRNMKERRSTFQNKIEFSLNKVEGNRMKSNSVRQGQEIKKVRDAIVEDLQQSIGQDEYMKDCAIEEELKEDSEEKIYKVCENSEQFFETDLNAENHDGEQLLSDSMVMDVMIVEEAGNGSHDNQNTLILDSQSLILESGEGPNQGPLISRDAQLQSWEASCILSNQNGVRPDNQPGFFSNTNNMIQNFSPAQQFNTNSNMNSVLNTDILTYSLTNTYTTIESLHDELANIKTGIEQSQKRGSSILKTIQRYARDIEENKLSDEDDEENVSSHEDSIMTKDVGGNDEETNIIKEIQSYYNKIHEEISNLRTIVNDNSKVSKEQPYQFKKHALSEKVPQKGTQQKGNGSDFYQKINAQAIDQTQYIIQELKKEMMDIINQNEAKQKVGKQGSENRKNQKSLRVIDLLENLQQSLLQSVLFSLQHQFSPTKQLQISESQFSSSSAIPSQKGQRKEFSDKQLQQNVKPLEAKTSAKTRNTKQSDFDSQTTTQMRKEPILEKKSSNKKSGKTLRIGKEEQKTTKIGSGATAKQKRNLKQKKFQKFQSDRSPQIGDKLEEPSPIAAKQKKDFDMNELQKTPEVFKQLSKISEINEKNFSSKLNNFSAKYDEQSFLKHLPPHINNFIKIDENLNSNQSITLQNDTYQHLLNKMNQSDNSMSIFPSSFNPGQDFHITLRQNSMTNNSQFGQELSKKKVGQGGDNTLTLIFDSEEEEEQEEHSSLQKVKEMEEYFFHEENSKIERGSSVNRSSFQVSNSFQAENLLFFNENCAKEKMHQSRNSFGGVQGQKLMGKSSFSSNSGENAKLAQLSKFIPQGSRISANILTSQEAVQCKPPAIIPVQSRQDKQTMRTINQDDISSTSKQSVIKYWNQFFNPKPAQPSSQVTTEKISVTSRNTGPMSKSAYQSKSQKTEPKTIPYQLEEVMEPSPEKGNEIGKRKQPNKHL